MIEMLSRVLAQNLMQNFKSTDEGANRSVQIPVNLLVKDVTRAEAALSFASDAWQTRHSSGAAPPNSTVLN